MVAHTMAAQCPVTLTRVLHLPTKHESRHLRLIFYARVMPPSRPIRSKISVALLSLKRRWLRFNSRCRVEYIVNRRVLAFLILRGASNILITLYEYTNIRQYA